MNLLISYLVAASIGCPQTKMVNNSQMPWVQQDIVNLGEGKKKCEVMYPDMPCVQEFAKMAPNNYLVTCGPRTKLDTPDRTYYDL